MAFGLCYSRAVFQGLLNHMLGDMLGQEGFVYLDDILVYSTSKVGHI